MSCEELRKAARELVRLKKIKEAIEERSHIAPKFGNDDYTRNLRDEYKSKKDAAWAALRSALESSEQGVGASKAKTYCVSLSMDEYHWLTELIEEKKLYYEKELRSAHGDDREWYLKLLPIAERVEQEFEEPPLPSPPPVEDRGCSEGAAERKELLANYHVDEEFRQTLHRIVDDLREGDWVTLTRDAGAAEQEGLRHTQPDSPQGEVSA